MINSLNPAMYSNGVHVQNNVPNAPVSIQNNNPQPVTNPNLNGLNAMAGYNQPVKTNKKALQPALPTVLQPEAVHALKGERITNSQGVLDSIIDKNDKTTVVYKMDPAAPNDVIRKILYIDNATGKLKRVQENLTEIKQGQMPVSLGICVEEYDNEGNIEKLTDYYDNGKYSVQQHEKMPDGSKKIYCVNSDKSSFIAEGDKEGNRTKTTTFTPSGQIGEIVYFNGNDAAYQVITYKNGIPAKIERLDNEVFTPEIAAIPAQDKDIIPAQAYILGYEPKNVQGEKTYFSNGMLQNITTKTANGTITHSFDTLGFLSSISIDENTNKKVITYNNDGGNVVYTIKETFPDKTEKTTSFEKDGSKQVNIKNPETGAEKNAVYAKTGQLLWYSKETEGNDERIYIGFDPHGNVRAVF